MALTTPLLKNYKQLKNYKLSQINSGQFTFKSGSSFMHNVSSSSMSIY